VRYARFPHVFQAHYSSLAATARRIVMLLSDGAYKWIPRFWILVGILFLFFGLSAGPEVEYFYAYIALGVLCLGRGLWILQARWNVSRRNRLSVAKEPTVIRRSAPENPTEQR